MGWVRGNVAARVDGEGLCQLILIDPKRDNGRKCSA